MPRLRVMTYNVRSLRDDAHAVGAVMRAAEPDLVLVQEAPRFARWRSHTAAIARRSGLIVITGGRTAAGNLLLGSLRVEAEDTRDVLLSRDPSLHRRGMAMAVLRVGATRFAVGGTHLDLKPAARLRHVAEISLMMQRFASGLPTLIGGDCNDVPGSPTWSALAAGRQDVFDVVGTGAGETMGVNDPSRRIDGLFAGPGFVPVSAYVPDSPDVRRASDHRPVVCELDLDGR